MKRFSACLYPNNLKSQSASEDQKFASKPMLLKTHFLSCLSILFCLSLPSICLSAQPISEAPDGRVNFPSNFQVEAGANLFIFGDYLYWIAQEDGLFYAHSGQGSGTASFPPTGAIDFNGRLKKIHPHWDSGVRAGVGCNFPKAGYDISLYWTWFATEASNSISSSSGTLFSIWGHPDATATGSDTFAKGKWDLDLNVLDLEWGRSSWFGGHFSLRPFFGIRGLWIDQELKNTYRYATSPAIIGKWTIESDYRGAGLRFGADSRYTFPYGFAIYGMASGSLLYGRFHTPSRLKENTFTIGKTKNHFWQAVSSLQIGLGLSWDTHFYHDRLHIEFHAGWEANAWFRVNQMNHFMDGLSQGNFFKENSDLTLQGLIAGGRFDF